MNNIAIMPYISLHALQIQNVKRNVAKKVSINELNNEVIYPSETETETEENNVKQTINQLNPNAHSNIGNINNFHEPIPITSINDTIGSEINKLD